MTPALARYQDDRRGRKVLLLAAAPAEARAVIAALRGEVALADEAWKLHAVSPRFDVVACGIGKVNAGAALALLGAADRHACVISVGVAGSLPGGPAIGAAVAATSSVYADEGVQTPDRFLDCAAIGFPLGPFGGSAIAPDADLLAALRLTADIAGPIATVSTCSGTDALAAQVAARTGAIAEAMEGAAILHVAARMGIPAAEFRVISNTTGDRPSQTWALKPALERLGQVIARW